MTIPKEGITLHRANANANANAITRQRQSLLAFGDVYPQILKRGKKNALSVSIRFR
ncbi:hypothetical protein SMC92_001189 [Cronobacter dublinensis]|nr:hypothetical protein [Cronobacter dublinensis]